MRKAQDLPVLRAAAAEIKALRAGQQISQEELAHRAGVHRSFVARLETAQTQPTLSVLLRLAEALNADVGEVARSIALRYRKELRLARRSPRH